MTLHFLWREYYSYLWLKAVTARVYFSRQGFLYSKDGQVSAYATDSEMQHVRLRVQKMAEDPLLVSKLEQRLDNVRSLIKKSEHQYTASVLMGASRGRLYQEYETLTTILSEFVSAYKFTDPLYAQYYDEMIFNSLHRAFPQKSSEEIYVMISNYLTGKRHETIPEITPTDYKLFEIINKISRIRFLAKKSERKLSKLIYNWSREVARRTTIAINQVSNLSPEEIRKLLCGKIVPNLESANVRQNGFAMEVIIKNHVKIINRNPLLLKRAIKEDFPDCDELSGLVAYPGKIIGRARIVPMIFDQKEYDKFISSLKAKDIVVAPMTSPMLAPAFNIVSAVVTDEGGLMSHAALLSRERKLPCVIGTHMATKIIVEGDRLLVDARKGVVKKLNKYGKTHISSTQ